MRLNNYLRINLLILLCLVFGISKSQNSWVYFNSKCSETEDFFKASVCQDFIGQMKNDGIPIIGQSKWLNAVCISDQFINRAKSYSFVSQITSMGQYAHQNNSIHEDYNYGQSDWQLDMIKLKNYHKQGNTGKDITIALFDGGFWKVDSLPIFDSLWYNNQILATKDFVNNGPMKFNQSTHGMQVLALTGINYPDSMMGAAPKANFILARTENTSSETHLEELNWINALEWADSIGVDIIHSSLGYSLFDTLQGDYTYEDMDGKSTIITIAAQLAVERGIFVTNSAGNSGNKPWYYITAPCDGKDVLCVGAVDSFRQITSFSSRGPSSDGRIKPEVCAMGRRNTIPNSKGVLKTGSGTSFSGPLIAGMVACLKSKHTDKTNRQIFNAVIQSCHMYENPDFEYGYGIPDVLIADSILNIPIAHIKTSKELNATINPNPAKNRLQIRSEPGSTYHLTDNLGKIVQKGFLSNWINFININDLNNGFYTLKVIKGKTSITKKLIIN
jgi:subtilisin family serine protease